jgi:hypothetical protein
MHSPLAYGLIFSVHQTHLTLREEWQRNNAHLIRQPATSSRTMALNTDTRENVITWFTREFGFSRNAATALHDVQALKDTQALSELDDDDAVTNVCKAVGKDVGQSVAKIAATKLKLTCFWVRHQYPILSDEADTSNEDTSDLEANGPFVPTFPVDSKKVWVILLACFGLSSAWQYVKKYANQQNGRQAWRTLHDHFFVGDKVNTMVANVLSTLKALHYSGDRRNFTFDKYCTAHVDQHNQHAALAEYDVAPLDEV